MDDEDDNSGLEPQISNSLERGVNQSKIQDENLSNEENITDDNELASRGLQPESSAERRWKRLRGHYSDSYLELFKATYEEGSEIQVFKDSQLGAVMWTAEEKSQFFDALSRNGRHQLLEIAAAVGTKSVIEVRDYILRLREAEADGQRYAKEAKNVTHSGIEAAVEIGPECEAKLEEAGDAFASFQDLYDLASARISGGAEIIDGARAQKLDEASDAHEAEQNDDGGFVDVDDFDSHLSLVLGFFQLSKMLELSERVFMNPSKDSEQDHWEQLAEEDEQPAMTTGVLRELYDLVVNATQRILQTAMFVAYSRQRASSSKDATARKNLNVGDVKTACEILKLPSDSWGYWREYPRRSGVTVVMGKRERNFRGQGVLTLEQVEAALSVRKSRGRKRSLSSLTDTSSTEGNDEDDALDEESTQDSLSIASSSPSEEVIDGVNTADANRDEGRIAEDQSTDNRIAQPADAYIANPVKRRRVLEEEEDDYAERLDQAARVREEARLGELLGVDVVKVESGQDIGRKPRAPRKTDSELRHWSDEVLDFE